MIHFQTTKTNQDDSTIIVEVQGQLTEATREEFYESVNEKVDEGFSQIILDCGGLGMLSSGGMAALMVARKRARQKSVKLYLTCVNSVLSELLEQTKLGKIFSIFPSTEGLMEQLRDGALAAT